MRELTTTQLAQLGRTTQTEAANGLCVEKPSITWRYCAGTVFALQPYTGTVFTVASSAEYVSASRSALTCGAAGGTADYLQTTSKTTWPALGSRSGVSQSSIVSTPTSALLMVKVVNRVNEPVEGALVTVTGASQTVTQTTPSAGCLIIGALAVETVKVAVSFGGWVDTNGKSPSKELTLSSGSLVSTEFKIAAPGS